MSQGEQFTVEQIRAILVNPIYCGMGPFPRVIEDDKWVRAFAKLLRREGIERTLRLMLSELRNALDAVDPARGANPPKGL